MAVFADTSVYVVFAIWATELTGSTIAAGAALATFVLPSIAGPFAGNVIDALPRQFVMSATSVLTGVAALGLFFVTSPGRIWILLVVAAVFGLGYVVFTSARAGLVVTLFTTDQIGPVNAVLRTTREILRLVAPVTGAAIYAVWGKEVFTALLVVALLAAGVIFTLIRMPAVQPTERPDPWSVRGLTDGIKHLSRTLHLRWLLVLVSVSLLVTGFYEVVLLQLLNSLGRPAADLGYLVTLQGVGAIVGGTLSGQLVRRWTPVTLAGAGLAIQGVGAAGLLIPTLPVTMASCVVFGFGLPMMLIGMDTTIQLGTPDHLQGRVGAAVEAATSIPFGLSFLISGFAVAVFGTSWVTGLMSVVMVLSALLLLRGRLRNAAQQHARPKNDEPPTQATEA